MQETIKTGSEVNTNEDLSKGLEDQEIDKTRLQDVDDSSSEDSSDEALKSNVQASTTSPANPNHGSTSVQSDGKDKEDTGLKNDDEGGPKLHTGISLVLLRPHEKLISDLVLLLQIFVRSRHEGVLENGPWIIRSTPIILNKWSPNISLTKYDLTKVPVWVKIHDVPLAGYTDDGLSSIASKIGKPLMLDSYTSTMCMELWGRPNYARAQIEVFAKDELKESLVVATPCIEGSGLTKDEVRIEYEWRPPRCGGCKVFGHTDVQCPKAIHVNKVVVETIDGFKEINRKLNKGGNKNKMDNSKCGDGFVVESSGVQELSNPFRVLQDLNEPQEAKNDKSVDGDLNLVDEDTDIELDENDNYIGPKVTTEGASTPESHVALKKLNRICNRAFARWYWTSNNNLCQNGTRIIVGWDSNIVSVIVVAASDQVMHCLVRLVHDNKQFYTSFVDASNSYIQRRKLWNELNMHKLCVGNRPWIILGDFNASLRVEESTAGTSRMTIAMREFQECIDAIQVVDLNYSGMNFIWNQSPNELHGMLKKIYRVLVNEAFLSEHMNAYAIFQPYRISDHSPAVVKIPAKVKMRPKMFRFSNYIVDNENFKGCVAEMWNTQIEGHNMYRVVQKLRLLKKPLRKMMWNKGNLHANVIQIRDELDNYNDALWDEERFLKQKAKVEWLRVGDSNSKYFHKVVKAKSNRTKINAITNSAGVLVEGDEVPEVIVSHYKMFIGTDHNSNRLQLDPSLFTSKISDAMAASMVRPVSNDEIKEAIFGIGDDKASGPDGYSSTFFKKAWGIVGEEVCTAVQDFFANGQLLTELNHTILTLLLKVESPSKCVTSTSFSICITGDLYGHFKGKRGLRKGDPMSPYLFTMVMEVLTLLFKHNISVADYFRFHPKCESQQIVNLCFADDLFVFSHASVGSVKVIADALNEFKGCSRLIPS
ncbi:uncharacterized protein [Rutidosis leptorrhynchoides]|uniref:uncharacterized protein n=1 Tax=Rutidosis leptorrhynchoides TaxID=125765 RepID=UPI003A9A46B4